MTFEDIWTIDSAFLLSCYKRPCCPVLEEVPIKASLRIFSTLSSFKVLKRFSFPSFCL